MNNLQWNNIKKEFDKQEFVKGATEEQKEILYGFLFVMMGIEISKKLIEEMDKLRKVK